MDELIAFLEARLAEDEIRAREGLEHDGKVEHRYHCGPNGELLGAICLALYHGHYRPKRALADIAADRELLAELRKCQAYSDRMFGSGSPEGIAAGEVLAERTRAAAQVLALERVIRIRAARFSDHPGYHADWKPQ